MQKQKLTVSISSGFIWRVMLVGLALLFLYHVRGVLILFFLSLILVSAAGPVVDKLQAKKIPRSLSTALIFLLLILIAIYLVYLIIPVIFSELKLLSSNIPQYLEGVNIFFRNVNQFTSAYSVEFNLETISANLSDRLANSATSIYTNTVAFIENIFNIFVILSLSFYMLVKEDAIKLFLMTLIPQRHQKYVIDLTERIQFKMGRWLIGQFSLIVMIFALDYLALTLLNVPYALVLALIGGFLEIIPYIGPLIALIPAALVGFTISPFVGTLVILLYVIIQQMENYIITPLVMKRAVGLNPVVVILSLLIGFELAGIIGVIIAVPAATAIGVFLGDLLNHSNSLDDNLAHKLQ